MIEGLYTGWDIGGAHLKISQLDVNGLVISAEQYATPIWQGLEILNSTLAKVNDNLSHPVLLHGVTVTGELSDLFQNRKVGVESLLSAFANVYTEQEVLVYAGPSGFLSIPAAKENYKQVASANWHATANYLGTQISDCVLLDIGSTTTDIVPVREGKVANLGYTDHERMQEDELLYTGLTRTPVMAVVQRVPVAGRWQSIAAEHFATMADVYRITGELDESKDLMPAADSGGKSIKDSMRRLARMVGNDFEGGTDDSTYLQLATYIADVHMHTIGQGLSRVLAKNPPTAVHIVGAGVGRGLAQKLALRHDYEYTDIEHTFRSREYQSARAADCVAAVAVAQLARMNTCPQN